MKAKNALYAQSGGVTSVINATACAVIETARKSKKINKVYAGKDGIIGILNEDLIDTSIEEVKEVKKLMHTPGGTFGSCRHKLQDAKQNKREYERLIEVFKASFPGIKFKSKTASLDIGSFDAQLPLGGLPKIFRKKLKFHLKR